MVDQKTWAERFYSVKDGGLFVFSLALIVYACASNASSALEEEGRPYEHICPITLQVMREPTLAADGYSYEKAAIVEHLKRNKKSPRTNEPLANVSLTPNRQLQTIILEWKPGRAMVSSAFDTKDAATIAALVEGEFVRRADLLHASKGKDIVAFLGNTGAGKSTLVNFLAGKKLVADGEDFVLSDKADATAMEIGCTGDSQTLYPKFIKVGNLLFFDLPGFNDTDGSERNLVNAAFIRSILMEANSVRAVFVAGQDEFTAQRAQGVKQLFEGIKRLVVAQREGEDIVNKGVFVVTKSTSSEKDASIEFFLKKTASTARPYLNEQLQVWGRGERLMQMQVPRLFDEKLRTSMLQRIKNIEAVKVSGINISVLYPVETMGSLERMFLKVMEDHFNRDLGKRVDTISGIDRKAGEYVAADFWSKFKESFARETPSILLLKEFCIDPYNKALIKFEKEFEGKRRICVEGLAIQKEARRDHLIKEAQRLTQEVIRHRVPKQTSGVSLLFDFAYHKDIYDHVAGSLGTLTVDPAEQELMRGNVVDFISKHGERKIKDYVDISVKSTIEKALKGIMLPVEERLGKAERTMPDFARVWGSRLEKVERTLPDMRREVDQLKRAKDPASEEDDFLASLGKRQRLEPK